MTTKPVVVYLGTCAPNDAIYADAGWRLIMGKNLNSKLARTPTPSPADEVQREPDAQDPESTPPDPAAD